MNTIKAYEQDIRYQIDGLPKFIHEFKIRKLSVKDQERCVITGAGDSLVAAKIAEYASDNKVHCVDPMDICLNPSIVKDRFLYALSISGNTSANIEAVKIADKIAVKTIAITANKESRLAKMCDEVLELKFRNSGMLTAGSIGFTTSMLACLSLVRNVKIGKLEQLFKIAEDNANRTVLSNHVYVIGSWITYPLAIYGCAKTYEVLGIKAQYAMLEQFCHMELFSAKQNDTLLIFSDDRKAKELYKKMVDEGFNVILFEPKGKTLEENLLYYSMLLQLIVLYNAKRLKLDECYFITNDRLRNISSSLIY
jgi:fructoselysine-6-P-deglycase FrlB-like protein